MRGDLRALGVLAAALPLSACARTPSVMLFGSLFPTWLVCIAAGVAATVAARGVLTRTGLEPHLGPLVVVYPSLVVLASCVAWLMWGRL